MSFVDHRQRARTDSAKSLTSRQAECTRLLHRVCTEDTRTLPATDVNAMVQSWLVDFDRADKVFAGVDPALDGFNTMHLVGVGICEALDRHTLGINLDRAVTDAQNAAPAVFTWSTALCNQTPVDLAHTVAGLQAAFESLYTFTDDGYDCRVDLTAILIAVLQRLGWWSAREFKASLDDIHSMGAMKDVMEPLAGGEWSALRKLTIAKILDATHTMLSFHRLLLGAECLHTSSSLADFDLFHLEASTETWYNVSMASDLKPGAVCEYKHEFGEMFHSLSQVVYYHQPNYARKKQLDLASLNKPAAPAINVLSLLVELAPDVPILYEHTGAGFRGVQAEHKFSFCVLQNAVVLVDETLRSYCCQDIRTFVHFMDNPHLYDLDDFPSP